ncbi:hypothetical protein PR048_023667 [Dryococelus australis]|uniref:HTH psq-type domain-containing protein n=1 Tax=Dryococelus australis TaxID=614101 RepID=A0ABQ9GUU2_9NEOP|nr:hypothetical protein PR048_023667 [Dryococelus australis]
MHVIMFVCFRPTGGRKYRDYCESRLELAVEAVKMGTSLHKEAEEFGIPKSMLNRKANAKIQAMLEGHAFYLMKNKNKD